jgi:hypothetical protein
MRGYLAVGNQDQPTVTTKGATEYMDDDQYYNELMTQVSARKTRSLDDVAADVRTNLNKTVEGILGAGKALQEGRDMHPSDQAFGNWCANEFPELGSRTRSNMMAIARRFGQHLNAHQLRYSVLAELAAPSVPDDVVEQAINAPIPMKLAEVKALKKRRNIVVPAYRVDEAMGAIKGISELFNKRFEGTKEEAANVLVSELIKGCDTDGIGLSIARDYVKWFMSMKEVTDLAEPELMRFLDEKPNLKVVGQEEAANEAWERSEEKRKQMEATPQQFDLLEHVKSTKNYDLNETARCLSINMEHLHCKSDHSEIKDAIRAAIIDDVVGIKVPALHGLAEILRELADEMPVINATKLN